MRKILLTLALAAFAFTANAQFVVGGKIDFNHRTGIHADDYAGFSTTNTNISITPKVGYQLADNMQVGAKLGWEYTYTRAYAGADDTYTSDPQSAIVFAPYFRYNFATWKKFNLFCEATLNFTMGLEHTTHTFVAGNETTVKNGDNYIALGINVVPGLNYAFSKNFSMDLYVNLASIGWQMMDGDGWGSHEWNFGADATAQSLNAHLNNFAIGFNYHF